GRSNYNPPSRFLKEISEDVLQSTGTTTRSFGVADREAPRRPAVKRPVYAQTGGDTAGWKTGDKAQHKKWGTGMVVSVKGEGDEVELDIAFPNPVGIKRLLAKFAPIEKA